MPEITIARKGERFAAVIALDEKFVALAEQAAISALATREQAMIWALRQGISFAKESALDPNWMDEAEMAEEINEVGN